MLPPAQHPTTTTDHSAGLYDPSHNLGGSTYSLPPMGLPAAPSAHPPGPRAEDNIGRGPGGSGAPSSGAEAGVELIFEFLKHFLKEP
eukprot:gene28447-31590_t